MKTIRVAELESKPIAGSSKPKANYFEEEVRKPKSDSKSLIFFQLLFSFSSFFKEFAKIYTISDQKKQKPKAKVLSEKPKAETKVLFSRSEAI